jgi:hypothetical protein
MSTRLVLYFTATEHSLYQLAGGALALEATFGADAQGLQSFRASLQGRKGALVYVVADVAGEDFHEDQIPYLRGGDREAVVQRRLAQRYRDTRLATALSLGFTAGERRTERLLLASFSNTEQFAAWIDAIVGSGARLSGVYSVPLLAPALAARLDAGDTRCLVVTTNSAGLRQCYVEDGRLRFARLERIPDVAPDALAAFVRAETLRLIQYLSTLRSLPRDGPPLRVLVIAPSAQCAALEHVLVSDARITFQTIVATEAARKVGIKQPAAALPGEQLSLHLAVRKPPKDQFARVEDRRGFFLWKLQRTILALGGAALVACAAVAAYRWYDWYSLRNEAAAQRDAASQATTRYRRITATFPVTQTTTENLKTTVVEFTRIAQRSASPEAALVYLSGVVDKFPQMDLDSIVWSVDKAGAAEAPRAGAAPGGTAPGGAAPAAEFMQVLEISGRVNATRRSDYRAITGQVQQFAESLRTDPAWRILRTQLPFDVTSEGTLSGDIGTSEGNEAPRFSVTVGRPLK